MRNVISAVCIKCGAEIEPKPDITVCPHCGGILDIKYDYKYISSKVTEMCIRDRIWVVPMIVHHAAQIVR